MNWLQYESEQTNCNVINYCEKRFGFIFMQDACNKCVFTPWVALSCSSAACFTGSFDRKTLRWDSKAILGEVQLSLWVFLLETVSQSGAVEKCSTDCRVENVIKPERGGWARSKITLYESSSALFKNSKWNCHYALLCFCQSFYFCVFGLSYRKHYVISH